MTADDEAQDPDQSARKLSGAMLEHSGLVVERMPGLAAALDQFIAEAQRAIAPLAPGVSGGGAVEEVRATTLFQAISDCAGLTAAIYSNAEPEARLLIALDDRIDDLVVASIFGESISSEAEDDPETESPRARTTIETTLVEEFARALGNALEAGFAPLAPLALTFERLVTLTDAFALGRRDMPAAAARFSLPMSGGLAKASSCSRSPSWRRCARNWSTTRRPRRRPPTDAGRALWKRGSRRHASPSRRSWRKFR